MGIRASIGLAFTIIVLKLLMGDVFSAFENVLVQVLSVSKGLLAAVAVSLPQ